jgi:hypothetical protein
VSIDDALAELRSVFSPSLPEDIQDFATSMPSALKINTVGSSGPASLYTWQSVMGPVVSFPFYTPVARVVWKYAKKILKKEPDVSPLEIVRKAMLASKMSDQEMTPEDFKILEMAISWAQNKPVQPSQPSAQVDHPISGTASY